MQDIQNVEVKKNKLQNIVKPGVFTLGFIFFFVKMTIYGCWCNRSETHHHLKSLRLLINLNSMLIRKGERNAG